MLLWCVGWAWVCGGVCDCVEGERDSVGEGVEGTVEVAVRVCTYAHVCVRACVCVCVCVRVCVCARALMP